MATQTIDGKIFQLKNAAGTENRFPRTVMEAVYGLNTYLQQQFAGLANLYEEKGYVAYNATTKVLTVGGVNVDLANLSDYYTKTQADGRYLKLTGGTLTGQLVSTVATGTSPLSVTSTTLNANLNADLLDGKHLSEILASNVASATKINETSREDEEFVFQATPVHDINDGFRLDRIKGRTLAWNQLCPNGDHSEGTTGIVGARTSAPYETITESGGIVTYSIAANGYGFGRELVPSAIVGHKYLLYSLVRISKSADCRFSAGGTLIYTKSCAANAWASMSYIHQATTTDRIVMTTVAAEDLTSFDSKVEGVIDLTLLFGAGNEPSTVEEFEAMFPNSYYPYNAGTLISNDASALETVGFNQWDEEWENGYYIGNVGDVATKATNSSFIRNTNRIEVMPSTPYYLHFGTIGGEYLVMELDENNVILKKNVLSSRDVALTTQSQTHYLVWYISQCSTYNNDICINLSDPTKNGTYEPYWKRTINLGLNSFKVKDGQGNVITITGGLKSAGTVHDEIVGNKYIKRIGEVDLGTLSWVKKNTSSSYRFEAVLPGAKRSSASYLLGNIISAKYVTISPNNTWEGNNVGVAMSNTEDKVLVFDSSYTDAATFKTAMSGVMLYYELATPIEYEPAEPMPMTGKIDGYGTMRRIGASEPSAPFRADITYGLNPGQTASDLSALVASIYRDTLRINGLDVAGIATIAGGVKLTDTKKIWFDDTHYLELKDGYLHTNLPIVSDSYITAGAVNS